MTRAQIARDIAAQKGIDCPTEGTKAWLALVLEGTEEQLEAATDAADRRLRCMADGSIVED